MRMIKGTRTHPVAHLLFHYPLTHSLAITSRYYDDVAISQDEVRKLVLKSFNLDTSLTKDRPKEAAAEE